jgi:hypothetical protein
MRSREEMRCPRFDIETLLPEHPRDEVNDDCASNPASAEQVDQGILGCRIKNRCLKQKFHGFTYQKGWVSVAKHRPYHTGDSRDRVLESHDHVSCKAHAISARIGTPLLESRDFQCNALNSQ